jgi:hypothetical protein
MKEVIEQVAVQKLEDVEKFLEAIKTFLIKDGWL